MDHIGKSNNTNNTFVVCLEIFFHIFNVFSSSASSSVSDIPMRSAVAALRQLVTRTDFP